jgi:phage portal protein BeeE
MAHWSPLPDPEAAGLGQSWITPAVREIQGDIAATQHKLTFFKNGATPNMVVSGITAATKAQFDEIVGMLEQNHTGIANAYRTLYLTSGADAKVVGADLKQIDFKATQGAGETRIAILSRVPAALLGISEGLAGSSLNAGNFSAARRMFTDTWVMPTLQDLAACLAPLVRVPADAELWFDTADMTLLREDAKDAAEIAQIQMATAVAGVNGGWEPESVKAFIRSGNIDVLKHTNLLSVQLQQPGAQPPGQQAPPAADGG